VVGGTGQAAEGYEHVWREAFGIQHVVDLDPADPPRVESEATYLARLGLLTPAERRALATEAFVPEGVLAEPDEDGADQPDPEEDEREVNYGSH
jgi:hypothetical protein